IYYQFVRDNQLFLKDEYIKAPRDLNFPKGSFTVKSSWRILPPGENPAGLFTTRAEIYPLACKDGSDQCQGEMVISSRDQPRQAVTAARVGLPVVGVVDKPPEFVWSTFEHLQNAPDLPPDLNRDSPDPVSRGNWTFYAANTPAMNCNVVNAREVCLDVKKQQL